MNGTRCSNQVCLQLVVPKSHSCLRVIDKKLKLCVHELHFRVAELVNGTNRASLWGGVVLKLKLHAIPAPKKCHFGQLWAAVLQICTAQDSMTGSLTWQAPDDAVGERPWEKQKGLMKQLAVSHPSFQKLAEGACKAWVS